MFESAAEGYVVGTQFGICFEQIAGALHLYFHNERCGRIARQCYNLAMELPRTHAKLLCQCVHVELLLVEQQIDIVHCLGEESSFGIRQFHLLLLLLVACGFLAELIAQRVLSVDELFDDGAQFVHAERFGQIGIGTGFKSLNAFLLRNLGCYYYNRYMVYSLVASYLTAQFQSVHSGHHNVGNDNVGHDVFCLLQSVVAVRSVSHRIPPPPAVHL